MMPDDSPADFTQTVVGTGAVQAARSTTPSSHSSQPHPIEGRFPPGTLLNGRYRIIALLGRGGMGEVYRATDLTLGQSVALKFLPHLVDNDPRWLERFHSEVRIARQVSHPNVCRVYDIGESEGLPFLSMEYVDGEDLSTLLLRIGRLPTDKALEISRKICAGLAAAHDRGVIHRDLKPQNIMLDKRGEVLICDFGLAAVADQLSGPESRQGTPAYMAPEQLKGTEVTQQSDIYSLGLVLYEIFTARKAYSGTTANELLNQQEAMSITSMISLATDIDPSVEKVIRLCLDPTPAHRPKTALIVSAGLPGGDPLTAALAAGQTPSPELVAASRSEGLGRRHSIPLLAFCLLFLASFPFFKGHIETLDYTPLDLAPAALQARSQELIKTFGYPEKPMDWEQFFETRGGVKTWLEKQNSRDWNKLFAAESPILYAYRQSNDYLTESPDGLVRWNRPGFDAPGMVRLMLDSMGNLILFEAIPSRKEESPTIPWNENHLFEAMSFDRSKFAEAPALRTPGSVFDQRVSLRGPHPRLPGTTVDLQYTTWKGRLTSLYIQAPWSPPISDSGRMLDKAQNVQQHFITLALLGFLFFSASLAHKNWISNRADRRGAFHLFVIRMILLLSAWLLSAHYIPDLRMFSFAGFAIAEALLSGLVLWQLYLALEPALRARWPKSIITWNRILSGNFTDPAVGSHILMGVAMGIIITSAFLVRDWFSFQRSGLLSTGNISDLSTRDWIASHLLIANSSLSVGLLFFFVIFGLKVLFRRELPAIVVSAILLSLTNGQLFQSQNVWLDAGVYTLISLFIMIGLIRFGLLTTLVAVFITNSLGRAATSTDPFDWFMPFTITTLVMAAVLAIYGFWRSLGNQHILGETAQ
ncbi:serine/threonine-protein kinase [Bryobacter aggregatus]|uniref:serine/threonine-protein kinase n=1 Tax=Bryobacter aggregatus TaxID=360054 RepID=UPI0004E235D8|nr:serine/threonine-protein kinase [Bryobacter aggregatus]